MPALKNQRHEIAKAKTQVTKRPGGRPASYQPDFAKQAQKLCEFGHSDLELADFFGVTVTTVANWKIRYREFLDALKTGKAYADERVERSLYHRAVGYSFDAEEVFQYQGKVVRAKVRKHVPPDTTAMIFWLKNRRKDQWRDVHRHEHGGPGAFSQLTDEELAREMLQVSQQLLVEGPVIDHDEGK